MFTAGYPAKEMFLITRGIAGLSCPLIEGSEGLFCLTYPGHLINVCATDPAQPGPVMITALTHCHAYRLPIKDLQQAQNRDPCLGSLVQRSLQDQVNRRTAALAKLLALGPSARLEILLHELAIVCWHGLPEGPASSAIPLTDDQLAMLLGLSVRQFKRIKKGKRSLERDVRETSGEPACNLRN
jgi:CRP-like cAMP-binding protein